MTLGVSERLNVKRPWSATGLRGLVKDEAELPRLCRRAWLEEREVAIVVTTWWYTASIYQRHQANMITQRCKESQDQRVEERCRCKTTPRLWRGRGVTKQRGSGRNGDVTMLKADGCKRDGMGWKDRALKFPRNLMIRGRGPDGSLQSNREGLEGKERNGGSVCLAPWVRSRAA